MYCSSVYGCKVQYMYIYIHTAHQNTLSNLVPGVEEELKEHGIAFIGGTEHAAMNPRVDYSDVTGTYE